MDVSTPSPIPSDQPAPDLPPRRVLVVDDDPAMRELLATQLAAEGMVIVADAGNGAAALEQAELHRPDLVVLDIAMPGMDGYQALPQLRNLVPEATIVVVSGMDRAEHEPAMLASGAHLYLDKSHPWDIGRFIRAAVDGVDGEVLRAVLD